MVRVARFAKLALVQLLGGVDMLVHERREALLEFGAALAWLEVHRSPFPTQCGGCISSPRVRRSPPAPRATVCALMAKARAGVARLNPRRRRKSGRVALATAALLTGITCASSGC